MLVRFNKGPWHRRLREMPPHEVSRGVINVAVRDPKFDMRTFQMSPQSQVVVAPGHKIAIYRVKMITVDLGNGRQSFPSVYPDGAICFEHTETV